jgi:hypothetical protein
MPQQVQQVSTSNANIALGLCVTVINAIYYCDTGSQGKIRKLRKLWLLEVIGNQWQKFIKNFLKLWLIYLFKFCRIFVHKNATTGATAF